jgi:glycosyltransferase involved in cell wall biosynthesis
MKKVVIIQKSLVQYRKEFFEGLRKALYEVDVDLTLIYGKQNNAESLRNDEVDLEWSKFIPNRTINIGSSQLIWQPCLKEIKGKDLIIVESANKLLLNYWLMLTRHFSRFKLAFWGHGRNMQGAQQGLANRFKSLFLKSCDWWFAYTQGVKQFLIEKGYPENQITAVQNAIDTSGLQVQYQAISDDDVQDLKLELGIEGHQVGLFCGGIYPEKLIDFLLESCLEIKTQVPDFHMIFIGAGIDAVKIKTAAQQYPWIHYVGPKFGAERLPYFKLASLFLMPGLVGLAILDAFAFETPIVTTDYEFHSPEIEYLEQGKNGIMVENTLEAYVAAVVDLFQEDKYLQMIPHCRNSAKMYTIEKMVDHYKQGILAAIN